eukprot:GHVP01020058.1.p1 GENE.GHVP01020058.1~~GHVP01020058.1.p1  ORF type:complete len:1167 (-),score=251.34 GHVP01020058.1:153-3653(-)
MHQIDDIFFTGVSIWISKAKKAWRRGKVDRIEHMETTKIYCLDETGEMYTTEIKEIGKEFAETGVINGQNDIRICLRSNIFADESLANLADLSCLNEASVLQTIKGRYKRKRVYTQAGWLLVSVNPYCEIEGLYAIKEHEGPHIYKLAEEAYQGLYSKSLPQSILISGESGSGKTVCAGHILKYLSIRAGDKESISNKILAANTVLEFFGNSKTAENNNSSRFGKYTKVFFTQRDRSICGAQIERFLLETSRVVSQETGESGYHIFNAILNAPESLKDKKGLNSGFNYAKNKEPPRRPFEEFWESLETTGLELEEREEILSGLVAILHIGNIEKTDDSIEYVSQLLGINRKALEFWLNKRILTVKGETIEIELNENEREVKRDTLSKRIYSALFDFLLFRLNNVLKPSEEGMEIGILDIYGFERMEKNGFEQFFINYANEKLQLEFTENVLKEEQEIYKKEGVDWEGVPFYNRAKCIDIIEGKEGVIELLNDECFIPGGNDKNFVRRVLEKNTNNSDIIGRDKIFKEDEFYIEHFAGNTIYKCDMFLEKNRSTNNSRMGDILLQSDKTVIREIGKLLNQKSDKESEGSILKKSLCNLVETVKKTDRHYIRCIKPNRCQKAFLFDPRLTREQLLSCGVLETIRLYRSGFQTKLKYEHFNDRFGFLCNNKGLDRKEKVQEILEKLSIGSGVFLGHSRILLKADVFIKLENRRKIVIQNAATTIQKHMRTKSIFHKTKIKLQSYHKIKRRIIMSLCINRKRILIEELERKRLEEEQERILEEERKNKEKEQKDIQMNFIAIEALKTEHNSEERKLRDKIQELKEEVREKDEIINRLNTEIEHLKYNIPLDIIKTEDSTKEDITEDESSGPLKKGVNIVKSIQNISKAERLKLIENYILSESKDKLSSLGEEGLCQLLGDAVYIMLYLEGEDREYQEESDKIRVFVEGLFTAFTEKVYSRLGDPTVDFITKEDYLNRGTTTSIYSFFLGKQENKLDRLILEYEKTINLLRDNRVAECFSALAIEGIFKRIENKTLSTILRIPLTWELGASVQYNVLKIEEGLSARKLPAVNLSFKKIIQASKIIQLSKYSILDLENILAVGNMLELWQIRSIIIGYVPGKYEQGISSDIVYEIEKKMQFEIERTHSRVSSGEFVLTLPNGSQLELFNSFQ